MTDPVPGAAGPVPAMGQGAGEQEEAEPAREAVGPAAVGLAVAGPVVAGPVVAGPREAEAGWVAVPGAGEGWRWVAEMAAQHRPR